MSYDWRRVLIGPDATIHEAIATIDRESLRIALVVDDDQALLGVVTDGDVRRGLLKQIPIDASVTNIMEKNPQTASLNDSRSGLLLRMEKNDLLHMPIVENGVIVGLETLSHLLVKKYENPVFVMAGGFGTRLRPLTNNCPKPMLKVGGRPILETIIKRFIDSGFQNFFISTHYMPEVIQEHFGDGSQWGVRINYIHENAPLGTGGALGLLPKNIPDLPIIMINGDVLTKIDFEDLLRYHEQQDSVATMCVREYNHQIPFGVIQADGERIVSMVEKPVQKYFVNAGVYAISRSLVDSVLKNEKVDMPSLLERCIAESKLVSMFPVHEYWLDIGRMNDFEKAQNDFVNSFACE